MNGKEPKTKEAPTSLWPDLTEAQQVTSTNKNKMKPNKVAGHVAAGKNLLNTTEEWERERRRKEVQNNLKIGRIKALKRRAPQV